jgi:hypothetical protein
MLEDTLVNEAHPMAEPVASKLVATKPNPKTKDEQELADSSTKIEGPPEESFDEKYNKRMEFPLAVVSGILFHVLVGALLIVVLVWVLGPGGDRSGVPVKLVALQGLDDSGEGSTGSGGIDDPAVRDDSDSFKGLDSLLDPSKIPEIKENSPTIKYLDPTGNLPISAANAQAYDSLSESVRKKLLGQRQGAGKEQGSGYDGSQGKGPGGTGADSTLGRNMRWVLRFKVTSGGDYLDQLRAMEAEILVPIPNTDKCIIIPDTARPKDQRTASDDDMRRLADKIKFSDTRPEAVKGVARTLGLDFTPTSFWAFFPKRIEDELSKKETGYRNRRAEDIEETIFRVRVTGSGYELIVDEQKIKR